MVPYHQHRPSMSDLDEIEKEAKRDLADTLVRWLGTAQTVEEYVGVSGYRLKRISHGDTDGSAATWRNT